MASGEPVVQILDKLYPTATPATPIGRAGGSTPGEGVVMDAFDAAAIEYLDFVCRLSGYDGGGLTFTLGWIAASATSGSVQWGMAVRRFQVDAEDLDVSHTYVYNEATSTAASASGEVQTVNIAFTDGADMDSWADGELAIVRVERVATDATNDTMAGDAQLWQLWAAET